MALRQAPMVIGSPIPGSTNKSLLFASSLLALAQDNASLNYDSASRIINLNGFQIIRTVLQTTDGTVQTLATFTLSDNTVWQLWAFMAARRTDGGGQDRAAYIRRICVFRAGGVATLQGAVDIIGADKESDAVCNATMDVDGGNNARVRVNGVAAKTFQWECYLFAMTTP